MSRRRALALAALAGLLAGLTGYAAFRHLVPASAPLPQRVAPAAPVPPARLPEFTLKDLDGRPQSSSAWAGRVRIVNFWATWCAPCRKEIPHFITLQRRYGERGLQIIGVAIDDAEPVRGFVEEYGINYPVLLGADDGIGLAQRLGNDIGALPYTVFADAEGRILHAERGVVELEEAEAVVAPLLGIDSVTPANMQ